MGYYLVCGPSRWVGRQPFGDNPDPGEPSAEAWEGEAPNAHSARWMALRSGALENTEDENRGDGCHPLSGVTVEKLGDGPPPPWDDEGESRGL